MYDFSIATDSVDSIDSSLLSASCKIASSNFLS